MRKSQWAVGLIFALATTGVLLSIIPPLRAWYPMLVVTIVHIILALILAILVGPFLWQHIGKRRRWIDIDTGDWSLLVLLIGILVSGCALVIVGQRGQLAWLHGVLGLGLVFFLVRHTYLLFVRRITRSLVWMVCLAALVVLVVGATLVEKYVNRMPNSVLTIKHFFPAPMRLLGEIPDYDKTIMTSDGCALCHAEIAKQWEQSIHAVADTELIYARVVEEFRQNYGIKASNWCAGCHSPLRLAREQLTRNVADVDQPNVDCIVCHSVRQIAHPVGNNDFSLEIKRSSGYELGWTKSVSDWLLLIQPAAHQERWNASIVGNPEFCGTCHRQVLPEFLSGGQDSLVLQDTFTEWQESKYNNTDPAVRRTCQDCHMPLFSSLSAGLGAPLKSHLFAGGNAEIAQVMGAHDLYPEQKRLLASAATISVMATKCNLDIIELQVNVTNSGAGHNLPTGVTDLRQVWLEVTILDSKDEIVFQSGAIDEDGSLDPEAVLFGVILGDAYGQPVNFHDIGRARQVLADTTIPPGETRKIKYTLPLLDPTKFMVTVRLLYRVIPQTFINHYLTSNLRFRTLTMASVSTTLDIPALCTS